MGLEKVDARTRVMTTAKATLSQAGERGFASLVRATTEAFVFTEDNWEMLCLPPGTECGRPIKNTPDDGGFVVFPNCRHSFHRSCTRGDEKQTCPLCDKVTL